jgi:hypothetical protein
MGEMGGPIDQTYHVSVLGIFARIAAASLVSDVPGRINVSLIRGAYISEALVFNLMSIIDRICWPTV